MGNCPGDIDFSHSVSDTSSDIDDDESEYITTRRGRGGYNLELLRNLSLGEAQKKCDTENITFRGIRIVFVNVSEIDGVKQEVKNDFGCHRINVIIKNDKITESYYCG